MFGIGGRAIVELDDHLDLAGLPALHEEIAQRADKPEMHSPVHFRPGNLLYREGRLPDEHYGHLGDEFFARYGKEGLSNDERVPDGYKIDLRNSGNYMDKHDAGKCVDGPWIGEFPLLQAFARSLPLRSLGRIIIFVNTPGKPGILHRDHAPPIRHRTQFVWLRTQRRKRFWVFDEHTGDRSYVEGHTALFNTNDWHGSDAAPELTFSVRFDGLFTSAFERVLGLAGLDAWDDGSQMAGPSGAATSATSIA